MKSKAQSVYKHVVVFLRERAEKSENQMLLGTKSEFWKMHSKRKGKEQSSVCILRRKKGFWEGRKKKTK